MQNLNKETKYTFIQLRQLSATKRLPLLAKMEAMAPFILDLFSVGAFDNIALATNLYRQRN